MQIGKERLNILIQETNGLLREGEILAVAGFAGLSDTLSYLQEKPCLLTKRFSRTFLRESLCVCQESFLTAASFLKRIKEESLFPGYGSISMERDGFLPALWKLAEASRVGLCVDLGKVPVRQETIEICEALELNPYTLPSAEALIIGLPTKGGEYWQDSVNSGLLTPIGIVTSGPERSLYCQGRKRYLERPALLWQE
ncbi:MAG: hydrogenase maturation factor [Blautia sp.]|nr:hydrogenase maturation factor [Blautia sp.]